MKFFLTAGLMLLVLSGCQRFTHAEPTNYVLLYGPPYKLWNGRTCWTREQCEYRATWGTLYR